MSTHVTTLSLLEHTVSMLDKQSDQVLQEQLGIGLSQFKILQALQSAAHTTQRAIAVQLGQTEASISRQVKLMLAAGLLQSVRSPQDHREHLTVVTAKGARLAEAAVQALERYHRPLFNSLSERQQEQLSQTLGMLHGQICSGHESS